MAKSLKTKLDFNRRGFTLIEILIVMLITSILVLGINASYQQAHTIWQKVEKNRPIYQDCRLFFENMQQELACLYFPKTSEEQKVIPFSLSSLPDGTTEISFFTLNPAWKTTSTASYMARVCYRFTRDSQIDRRILTRSEQYFSGEKPIANEVTDEILDGLSEFNIWALDGNEDVNPDSWKDNFENDKKPPKAIKIQLKWQYKDSSETNDFQTIIVIPCQGPLVSE